MQYRGELIATDLDERNVVLREGTRGRCQRTEVGEDEGGRNSVDVSQLMSARLQSQIV